MSIKHDPVDWLEVGKKKNWFTPSPELSLYNLVKPKTYMDFGFESGGVVYLTECPHEATNAEVIRYNYSSSYELMIETLSSMRNISKVLIKPNNTGFIGPFLGNPKLREIMEKNNIKTDPDLQPMGTQPAVIAGIIDTLLELGVQEVHIGENMLWGGGTPGAFWETGYTQLFSGKKYLGKVSFVDFYEKEEQELIELKISGDEHDLGFFTKMKPQRASLKKDMIWW